MRYRLKNTKNAIPQIKFDYIKWEKRKADRGMTNIKSM